MSDRLRVLVVSPYLPYPPTWGAAMRVYQLVRHLALGADVTLLCYVGSDDRVRPELAAVCEQVLTVPRAPFEGWRRRGAQARSLLLGRSFHGEQLVGDELQTALDQALTAGRHDVVQLEGSPLSRLRVPPGVPVVLDEHNVESEVLDRMAHGERTRLRRAYNRAEARAYRRLEDDAWSSVAACLATSERDAATVRQRVANVPVQVVPNGVDPEYFAPATAPVRAERYSLVFTGLLSYRPNLDGVRWFVDEVLPLVRRRRPGAVLRVVGAGTPDELAQAAGPGVEVVGRAPDLRPYLAGAACVVAPIRMGGGTRLKVLEALSMARPLVSTTVGCEGIDVRDGTHLRVADDPQRFADAVCDVLDQPAEAGRMGEAGRRLVSAEYSWASSGDRLRALLERVTPARDGLRAPP